ncbi:MAG: hypothetical protein ACXW3D_10640, partial [Caulobacteraceae bacterium]
LQNDAKAPVVSFQTKEDDKWSANWLAAPVRPGEAFRMAFGSTSGDCQVRTRVTFQGGDVAEADIDYCDAQKVLRVTAQGISWK